MMSVSIQALRRGVALTLLTGHLGWAALQAWRAVDWGAFLRPREDQLSLLERAHVPLHRALAGQQRVAYERLERDDERWNGAARFQLQYLLAPVLLDPVDRDTPFLLVEQRCERSPCVPGPALAPGRARELVPGLLLVEQERR